MRTGPKLQVVHLFAESVPSLVPVCWIRMLGHVRSRRFQFRVLVSRMSHLPESALRSAKEAGIEIVEIPALADAGDWIYSFRLRLQLKRLLRQWGTDLVHTHHPAAVGPALQCLKGLPEATTVHSLYLDPEFPGRGRLHRDWVRMRLRRRLAGSRRVIARDEHEEKLIEALSIAKRYQLERIPLSVDVEAIQNLQDEHGSLEPISLSPPEHRFGLFVPDVSRGPFKKALFSLRSVFDSSKEVTVWCVVPGGQVREVEKMSRRLRFPEQFHLVSGVLSWEWIGTRVRAAWIPGEDAESDVAAAISSAFGVPVFRFTSLEAHGAAPLGKQRRPPAGLEILKEILLGSADTKMTAPGPAGRDVVAETAELLSRCYNEVLRESRGGSTL